MILKRNKLSILIKLIFCVFLLYSNKSFSVNSNKIFCGHLFLWELPDSKLPAPNVSSRLVTDYLRDFPTRSKKKTPRFGIEIEAIIPRDIGIETLAETAYKYLEEQYFRVNRSFQWKYVERGFWQRRFILTYKIKEQGEPKKLIITEDLTVVSRKYYAPIEIISPIMNADQDFKDLANIVEKFKTLGLEAEPNSGGTHIHQEMLDPKTGEIGLLSLIYEKIEQDLLSLIKIFPYRENFTKQIDRTFLNAVHNGSILGQSIPNLLGQYFPEHHDRYHGLNLLALTKHGTIEYRYLNSTLNFSIIGFFQNFHSRLLVAIRSKNSDLLNLLQTKNQLSVDEVAATLGIVKSNVDAIRELVNQELEKYPVNTLSTKIQRQWNTPGLYWKNLIVPFFTRSLVPQHWEKEKDSYIGNEVYSNTMDKKFYLNLVTRSKADAKFKAQQELIEQADGGDLVPMEWIISPFYERHNHSTIRIGNTAFEMTSEGFKIRGKDKNNARAFYFNNPFFTSQYEKFKHRGMPPFSIGIELLVPKKEMLQFLVLAKKEIVENKAFHFNFNNCNQCLARLIEQSVSGLPIESKNYQGFSSLKTFHQLLYSQNPDGNLNIYILSRSNIDTENIGAYLPNFFYEKSSLQLEILRLAKQYVRTWGPLL